MNTNKRYVAHCNCNHPFQDSIYGKQIRLLTPSSRVINGTRECKCTVCLKVHQVKDN